MASRGTGYTSTTLSLAGQKNLHGVHGPEVALSTKWDEHLHFISFRYIHIIAPGFPKEVGRVLETSHLRFQATFRKLRSNKR